MTRQIALIANVCFEPYLRTCVHERFSCLSSDPQVNVLPFEMLQERVKDIESADIIAICLDFENLYPSLSNDVLSGKTTFEAIENDCINKCQDLYANLKSLSKANIIWFGFEDYYCLQNRFCGSLFAFNGLVDRINVTLSDMLKDDTFIDFKRLIATLGINNAYNVKGKYRWNAPYSKELIELMVDELYKQHLIATGNTKKCLALDCDNVLWGGILSEDGIAGIQVGTSGLGRPFRDFQRYLLDLYYHGVILVVCSKNDESDVLSVFREHTGMLLKEEYIACFKCNWNNKPDNIKGIAENLNIGLDSIVFVDDSVFEIESVKTMLPEVTAVLYQRDTVYDGLSCFNLKRDVNVQTVKERTNTYKTNFLRSELQKNASSYEDYIASLEMIVDIHLAKYHELSRISELTQRTNKCTNGTRYVLEQLKAKLSLDDYSLYTVCLFDKFSDLGIVGAIGIKGDCVELFSLSCRALGRGVEDKMIHMITDLGINKIKFADTGKNAALFNLMKLNGLTIPD